MKRDPRPTVLLLNRPTPAQPQNRRCKGCTDVHRGHPADEHIPPGKRFVAIKKWDKVLGCDVEQSGNRPREPKHRVSADGGGERLGHEGALLSSCTGWLPDRQQA